jgi:TolB-like protein
VNSHPDFAFPTVEPLVPRRRRPLVAVLPFASAQEDDALRLLGTEVADLLRESLACLPELSSILISSDFLSRAPEHALELICRQLRVGFLISGMCYRLGAGTSIYIELADTRSWHILWADFLSGNAHDLLDADSEAMRRVLAGLRHSLRHHPAY